MHEASHHRGGSTPKSLGGLSTSGSSADFIPQPGSDFVATASINELTSRALAYIEIGYAVHLSGPAGTGKTTLALHIASKIGRRCTLLHGDDELRGSDLLGKDAGYRRQSVRDNYVSSILKTEETVSLMWSNNRLTTACEQGHTVIYDEFTRSPAAANNAFLSILEEGILSIPSSGQDKNYVRVHPDFRAIFTSNPEEYVGVHKSQDALLDRMITLEVAHQDRETEIAIVQAKSGRSVEEVTAIVDIIRSIREKFGGKNGPTIRAALAIARILDHRKASVSNTDPIFIATCQDVLFYNVTRQSSKPITRMELEALIRAVLNSSSQKSSSGLRRPSAPAAGTVRNEQPTELDVSTRIKANIEEVANTVANLSESAAEIALGATHALNVQVLEKKADSVNLSDETTDNDAILESVSRRLPRPPMFESSGISSGGVVAKR
jgi:nitric oxide reductase NorQ protein